MKPKILITTIALTAALQCSAQIFFTDAYEHAVSLGKFTQSNDRFYFLEERKLDNALKQYINDLNQLNVIFLINEKPPADLWRNMVRKTYIENVDYSKQRLVAIVNPTNQNIIIQLADNAFMMVEQAKDEKGEWKDIEEGFYGVCASSFRNNKDTLKPGQVIMTYAKEYDGDFETEVRIKLTITNPNHETYPITDQLYEKRVDIYSKPFKMKINKAQFIPNCTDENGDPCTPKTKERWYTGQIGCCYLKDGKWYRRNDDVSLYFEWKGYAKKQNK